LRDTAKHVGFNSDALELLLLGSTEACTNAVKYGSYSSNGKLQVCIQSAPDEVLVRLFYYGEPFVFSQLLSNDAETLFEPGRGHDLMRRSLDEVHYRFRNGCTLVRLVKRA
jgi:anti-sigma regulatory factor (Ser/Thr protein kinase)